ncbi:glycosyltransferase [Nocardioides dongkuii]|uniref:glycosyltransferase n=1 Tax=Nocardioides dongkuii TaxID=2760089 RepID=UPI0015FA359A|nr:glycosyltransferase [Nocardioides dongkuii]
MIGYYVHHHGSGHLHRSTALAHALVAAGEEVTGLSSLPRPADWPGSWVDLPRDDEGGPPVAETAGGRLHWAPLGDEGLRARTAAVSSWIGAAAPRCVVVDVSVEVCLLVRLHGVPVVSVVLPGSRGDAAHLLGLEAADALVSMWPPEAHGMLRDVPDGVRARLRPLGALSRFPVAEPGSRRPGPRRVLVLSGTGGGDLDLARLRRAQAETPDWEWTVLSRTHGTWVDDPAPLLADADVVVTHAGQNALAEVASARTPAVVVPQDRPHEEQRTTASVLGAGGWPVLVEQTFPADGWAARLDAAARLDGGAWSRWCDGEAAGRFVAVVQETAGRWRVAS